jgi:hypothetical protein
MTAAKIKMSSRLIMLSFILLVGTVAAISADMNLAVIPADYVGVPKDTERRDSI